MKPEVQAQFAAFSARFEGRVHFMYLDVKSLVTTGIGNLIDPVQYAQGLPWQRNGSPATPAEIVQAWNTVKIRTDLALHGGMAYAGVTDLRLTDDAVDALVLAKAQEMDAALAKRFSGWDDLPWEAQLATLSLAWACGPAFHFPKFEAALNARDFTVCAFECQMNAAGNPGLLPRNKASQQLFLDAAEAS